MNPLITNIQRFCVHDGPGIRTTIFFKGCLLHCPWCANPENIRGDIEYGLSKDKCISNDGNCMINDKCSVIKHTGVSECDYQKCLVHAIIKYGTYYDDETLFNLLIADRAFFGTDGGITFSGGEPLLSLPYYERLLQKLKEEKINTAIETSLYAPTENLMKIIPYLDYFIVDIKIINEKKAEQFIGGNTELFNKNLSMLFSSIDRSKCIFRCPIVPGYTDSDSNIGAIKDLVYKYNPKQVEIFSVHNLAENKYKNLGIRYNEFDKADECALVVIKDKLSYSDVRILKI